jgi:ATP-dependent DNA helicase DinG
MTIFKDVKGLIHVPSYEAGQEIVRGLADERVITHEKHDFQERLRYFFDTPEPLVFVSPVCQQGVDFKQDRARFQIIVRIPYMNTSDEFVNKKVQNDFQWYNYKALVVFGQQIGRVNRSENDFGVTFLMDSRFNKFVAKNGKKLPKWLKDAIVYK